MIASLRSLPHPDAIAALVRRRYGLPVHRCVLIRSLANDVYEVGGPDHRYVLKVYGAAGWTVDEIAWEQELVTHLALSGVPVAAVVPLTDGNLTGELTAPEGSRPFALTGFVAGHKPQPPYDDVLYRDFGRLVGHVHQAADSFTSARHRRPFDLAATLDAPLRRVVPQLADRPDDARLVRELGARARREVAALAARGLEWGIRHGDVSTDNIHSTDRGLVLHDFDLAGPGWRSADLTGVRETAHWAAFRAGYQEVRELPGVEQAAYPWLRVVELVFNLMFHLVERPAFHGTESLAEGWADRELGSLRQLAATL